MGDTIGGVGAVYDSNGGATTAAIGSAIAVQAAAQGASIDALFGSLGLGGSINSTA